VDAPHDEQIHGSWLQSSRRGRPRHEAHGSPFSSPPRLHGHSLNARAPTSPPASTLAPRFSPS
jgi:hypothetical protein